jgi:hypothetical protein
VILLCLAKFPLPGTVFPVPFVVSVSKLDSISSAKQNLVYYFNFKSWEWIVATIANLACVFVLNPISPRVSRAKRCYNRARFAVAEGAGRLAWTTLIVSLQQTTDKGTNYKVHNSRVKASANDDFTSNYNDDSLLRRLVANGERSLRLISATSSIVWFLQDHGERETVFLALRSLISTASRSCFPGRAPWWRQIQIPTFGPFIRTQQAILYKLHRALLERSL